MVVNLTSRQDTITLQEVQYMLQTQEMRLEQLTSASPIKAHNAQFNTTSFKRTSNNGGNQNYYGHEQSNQRVKGWGGYGRGNGSGHGGNRPICQLCGRAGHVALKCYHRFDINFNGNPDGDHDTQQGQAN